MGDEIWRRGATDLAAAMRAGEVTSREVVEAHLARIEAVNADVNAVTAVLADEALAAADAADRALAGGEPPGPLHGVPFTVKENIDLTGSATTQGMTALAEAIPEIDAPHITQLKAAGAIPIGRTNLPDFGLRWHTDNALRGPTKNPWDAACTPGGSSGGEAAALATGMTPLGMGNDYGGSLRLPAFACGVASLRPTLGRVAWASAIEPLDFPITLQLFAVQGPMARHVRDLRLALGAMSGPDARDPWWTPAPLDGSAGDGPVRVAVVEDPAGLGVDPEIAAGVRSAADALADAGYAVEVLDPPQVADCAELWTQLVATEIQAAMLPLMEEIASPDAVRFLHQAMEVFETLDLTAYVTAFATRNAIARAWAQFQQEHPLVLGPVSARRPFAVGYDLTGSDALRTIVEALRLVLVPNVLGLPAAAVPAGESGGLPQGVQLIGPRYGERLCLDAGEAIEARLGVVTPIDPRAGGGAEAA